MTYFLSKKALQAPIHSHQASRMNWPYCFHETQQRVFFLALQEIDKDNESL
jgi:hypothetical protein